MSPFKNFLFFVITLTLGIIFFVIVSGRVEWGDVTTSLSLIRFWQFALLFVLTLLIHVAATISWQEILRHLGYRFSWRRLWRIFIIGATISFLTPIAFIGGEAIVLYLLKKETNIPWKRGINSLIILKLGDFIFHAIFILVGLIVFLVLAGFEVLPLFSLFILLPLGILLFLVYFFTQVIRGKSVIQPALRVFGLSRFVKEQNVVDLEKEETEIIGFFDLKQKRSRIVLGGLFLKSVISWAHDFCLLFFIIGYAPLLLSLVVHAFAALSVMFLLPATLGSLELLQAFALETLGFGSSAAISFSLIWRGMRLLVGLLSVFYLFYFTGRIVEGKVSGFFKKFYHRKKP